MGSLILPFQQLPLVLLGAFSNATGQTVSYVAYMGAVIPFTLICIAEYMLVLKYVVRLDVSQLKNFDTDELLQGKPVTFTKQQYCCALP